MATQHTVSDGAAVELVRFDAPSTRLVLHPGYQDPGGSGWSTHSAVRADERPSLLAAFNGGFKLDAGCWCDRKERKRKREQDVLWAAQLAPRGCWAT